MWRSNFDYTFTMFEDLGWNRSELTLQIWRIKTQILVFRVGQKDETSISESIVWNLTNEGKGTSLAWKYVVLIQDLSLSCMVLGWKIRKLMFKVRGLNLGFRNLGAWDWLKFRLSRLCKVSNTSVAFWTSCWIWILGRLNYVTFQGPNTEAGSWHSVALPKLCMTI